LDIPDYLHKFRFNIAGKEQMRTAIIHLMQFAAKRININESVDLNNKNDVGDKSFVCGMCMKKEGWS